MNDGGYSAQTRELGRCLVTGAGGFIGSHVAEALCKQGVQVRALVRYTSERRRGWLDDIDEATRGQIELVFGDVRDPDQMRATVAGCRTVLHLAALVGIPYSYASPRQNFETNAGGTLNLLEAARSENVERFVHVSSSEVYGTARYVPIDEEHPLVGQSPYSASKIAADQIAISYARSFDFPVVIVRPFNTFGPRQSMRAVIPTIIGQALWSDRIRLGALHTTRDFTFVTDTAAGLIAAAKTPGLHGAVLNLGAGREISIGDLGNLICSLVGRHLPIECEEERLRPAESEVERLCSDPSRARAEIGWRPTRSLREGLSSTIDWVRERASRGPVEEFVV